MRKFFVQGVFVLNILFILAVFNLPITALAEKSQYIQQESGGWNYVDYSSGNPASIPITQNSDVRGFKRSDVSDFKVYSGMTGDCAVWKYQDDYYKRYTYEITGIKQRLWTKITAGGNVSDFKIYQKDLSLSGWLAVWKTDSGYYFKWTGGTTSPVLLTQSDVISDFNFYINGLNQFYAVWKYKGDYYKRYLYEADPSDSATKVVPTKITAGGNISDFQIYNKDLSLQGWLAVWKTGTGYYFKWSSGTTSAVLLTQKGAISEFKFYTNTFNQLYAVWKYNGKYYKRYVYEADPSDSATKKDPTMISSSNVNGTLAQKCTLAKPPTLSSIKLVPYSATSTKTSSSNLTPDLSKAPNDPYYSYQWHLPSIMANAAWDYGTGKGAIVAILSSGVAYRNSPDKKYAKAPDLAGVNFVAGYDFVNNDAYPDDDYGLGTFEAGIIAQTTNNLLGCAGIAYDASIMPVKIMDSTGAVTTDNEVAGIRYAVDHGAHIVCIDFGGPGFLQKEQDAIDYAYNHGVLVVASAGNAGSSTPEYPAACEHCLAVSAVQYDDTLAPYSNYGSHIDLCAPGGNLTVDQNKDGYGDGILQQYCDGGGNFSYRFLEGTTSPAAIVAAVAALVVGKSSKKLSPDQLKKILTDSAVDLGPKGWDEKYGWGKVNAFYAVTSTH